MSDNDVISRMALYEKTAEWEAQALHMVELHLHDDDKAEWRKWSTVLAERSAFKYDVAAAPAVNVKPVVKGEWKINFLYQYAVGYKCSCCDYFQLHRTRFCPNCGAEMQEEAKDE